MIFSKKNGVIYVFVIVDFIYSWKSIDFLLKFLFIEIFGKGVYIVGDLMFLFVNWKIIIILLSCGMIWKVYVKIFWKFIKYYKVVRW